MMEIESVTAFLGWCVILNLVLLSVSAVLILAFKESISNLHSRLFHIEKSELDKLYFIWLGNYKIANIVFFLVPYMALKIIS